MDLIKEPQSGALVPRALQAEPGAAHLPLLGCAVRFKSFFGLNVQVYAFSVYGSADIISTQTEMEHEDLMSALLNSSEEKLICLKFLRDVTGQRAADGIQESLVELGGASAEDASAIQTCFPPNILKGMEIKFLARPHLDEIVLYGAWLEDGRKSLRSRALCRGLHEIYFGSRAVVRGLGISIKSRQTELKIPACCASSDGEVMLLIDIEAVEAATRHSFLRIVSNGRMSRPNTGSFVSSVESSELVPKATSGRGEGNDGHLSGEVTSRCVERMWAAPGRFALHAEKCTGGFRGRMQRVRGDRSKRKYLRSCLF